MKIEVTEGWLRMLLGLVKNGDLRNTRVFLEDKICEAHKEKCATCDLEDCEARRGEES